MNAERRERFLGFYVRNREDSKVEKFCDDTMADAKT